jgi:hypothetical protein
MNVFNEIMFIYGMTFLISMFVALVIKMLAKTIEKLPEGGFSIAAVVTVAGNNIRQAMMRNKKTVSEFKKTAAGSNDELLNFYHER